MYKPQNNLISRAEIADAIAILRREWEIAAEDFSLLEINASVGLMLSDLVEKMNLTSEERLHALGPDLLGELERLSAPEQHKNAQVDMESRKSAE